MHHRVCPRPDIPSLRRLDFLTVQTGIGLRHITHIGSRRDDRVHQSGICVHTKLSLHSEVPLVALLGLVHLGIALAAGVLC